MMWLKKGKKLGNVEVRGNETALTAQEFNDCIQCVQRSKTPGVSIATKQ